MNCKWGEEMFRGLYTATSAMETSQKKLDVISNNIANVNTNAFKRDVVVSQSFPETLMKKIHGQLPAEPYSNNRQVLVERDGDAYRLYTEGGYFTAEGPLGKSYSATTSFAVDEDGYLRTFTRDINGAINTNRGNYILDSNGNRVQVDGSELNINDRGQIETGAGTVDLVYTTNIHPKTNIIGTMNSGLRLDEIYTNFTQGKLEETGNPLDLAIDGQGFFVVDTPDGIVYTRDGNFSLNDRGELVTKDGYNLLGLNGPIVLNTGDEDFEITNFSVTEDGQVMVNGEFVDEIDIVNIRNVYDLRKYKHGYYRIEEGMEEEFDEFQGSILQGYQEGSNIHSVQEMVDMIATLRLYESNQKIVQTYDEILQKAVNEIGRV